MQNPQASSAAVIRNASERSILLDTDIETDRFFPQCQKDVTVTNENLTRLICHVVTIYEIIFFY
jgi:predicted nucleic acid-binding protein